MKKILTQIIGIMLVISILLLFSSCATTLKGTYTSSNGIIEQSFIFKDNNKVSVAAFGVQIEGDYYIKDGEITITYSLFNMSYSLVKTFEKNGNVIVIDGVNFIKEK